MIHLRASSLITGKVVMIFNKQVSNDICLLSLFSTGEIAKHLPLMIKLIGLLYSTDSRPIG